LVIRDAPPADGLVDHTLQMKEEDRRNLKRERSVQGDDEDEVAVVQSRRAKRRCLPTSLDEVIVLDN
jgi:hypothetical protein